MTRPCSLDVTGRQVNDRLTLSPTTHRARRRDQTDITCIIGSHLEAPREAALVVADH